MDIKILFIYSVELILLYLFKQTTKSAFSLKKKKKKKKKKKESVILSILETYYLRTMVKNAIW